MTADRPDLLFDGPIGGFQPLVIGVKRAQRRRRCGHDCHSRASLVDPVQYVCNLLDPRRERNPQQAAIEQSLGSRSFA